MKLVVVVRRGKHLNLTLSTIQFDQFGTETYQPIIFCDTWNEGFLQATTDSYTHALFVDSGTLFQDWPKWKSLLESYPHQGLVGHLIWHPSQHVYLDEQCWLVDLGLFSANQLSMVELEYPVPIRSDVNLHDDYTPLWIKPGKNTITHDATNFGQGLIAQQLTSGRSVVNWNNSARDLKFFIYKQTPKGQINRQFHDYVELAEHQLWIFNNETISSVNATNILTPGSGLFWILNIINPSTNQIQIVDISYTQLKFVESLWKTWNGKDYGLFVWQFIQDNNLVNYEIDQANLTALERLKLRSQSKFIEYVDSRFNQFLVEHNINNFVELWLTAQVTKTVMFDRANLIDWVLEHDVNKYDYIWTSNILGYKWTLMHTTEEKYQQFSRLVK